MLAELVAGNERFCAGNSTPHAWLEQAEQTARGQHPKAIVFGCIDSRVPAEVVFDQGIGDVFVTRIAGHVLDDMVLGSMEFAAALAGAKLIVVLGHTECGAVQGALDGSQLGHLTGLLAAIRPAIKSVGRVKDEDERRARVTEEHVRMTVREITARSGVLAGLAADGAIMIVGGVYDIATGRVRWLDVDTSSDT